MSFTAKSALAILFVSLFAPSVACAQRGALIEDLFRSMAEQRMQMERAKQKAERERNATRPTIKPSVDPYDVKLPAGFNRPTAPNPAPAKISVRSKQVANFADQLITFDRNARLLLNDITKAAPNNASLRRLLPLGHRVSASSRELIRSCDGLASLDPLSAPYRELDSQWRQLAFNLGSVPGLSPNCTSYISQCNNTCKLMAQQLNITAQFDRKALRDVMIQASSYMLALEDDLRIIFPDEQRCRKLTHDVRLLRQQLLREADRVSSVGYNEISSRFQRFANQWRTFKSQVYAINDPHLHRRLDRISECGAETYKLLRIAPPPSAQDFSSAIHRIEHGLENIMEQLNFRSMIQLQPVEQNDLLSVCRQLTAQIRRLKEFEDENYNPDRLRSTFETIDQGWASLQRYFDRMPTVNRGTISEIDRACVELRNGLGIGDTTQSISDLRQAAAALEGTAEYLKRELSEVQRKLSPNDFRRTTVDAANELYVHSRELHELLDRPGRLSDQRYFEKLAREAERMLEGYDELAQKLAQIGRQGLSSQEAGRLRGILRQANPFVAQIAAALLQ